MNNRIGQFLAAENISQSQFADSLGVSRASVSHILAGRNKPGAEFFENIARRYPDLSLEWLITGTGKMYKGQKSGVQVVEQELFASSAAHYAPEPGTDTADPPFPGEESRTRAGGTAAKAIVNMPPAKARASYKTDQTAGNRKTITKVVIFYDDNTFQELE